MVRISYITHHGTVQTVDAEPGRSLMEVAVGNRLEGIEAICGGNCYCGTCRVHIDPAWQSVTGGPTEYEVPLVEDEAAQTGACVRLACQIRVTDALEGLVVRLPESQS